MKAARIALLLAFSTIFSACAYISPNEDTERRVSPDYTATGAAKGVHAYLYGNRTLLELESSPALLYVKDETGASVEYERVGRHYRLNQSLSSFTAWINGRSVTFSPVTTTLIFSAPESISATPVGQLFKY